MDRSLFVCLSAALLCLGAALSVLGFPTLAGAIGTLLVSLGAWLGFGAAKAAGNVFIEGQPALKFEITPRRLSLVAALTIAGTLIAGFANVMASAAGGN